MKKLVLIALAAATGVSANAQIAAKTNATLKKATSERTSVLVPTREINGTFKTTGLSDTLNYLNNASTQLFDTSVAYVLDQTLPVDSGYYFGYNALGTNAYAEKFDFEYAPDTTFQIIGVRSLWTGTVNPASTKTVNITIWKQGAPELVPGFSSRYYEGFPDVVKKAETVSIKALGIGNANPDTIKNFYFATPHTGVDYNFYVGYEATYTWGSLNGDTISLKSTRNNYGVGNWFFSTNSSNDTFLLDRNAMRFNGAWYDLAFDLNFDLNLSVVPIIQFSSNNIDAVGGLSRNDLTFYGHFPNPAVNSTNIKFSLDKMADVTIQLTDMSGRVISTTKETKLNAGEHIVPLETSSLAAGNYVYTLSTSNGGAIAAKLTIAK
jgi:hypothetical protein